MIYLSLDYLSQRIEVSDSKIEKKKKKMPRHFQIIGISW